MDIHEKSSEIKQKGDEIFEKGNKYAHSSIQATAKELEKIGDAVRSAASSLDERNNFLAGVTYKAADQIDTASKFLENREPREILNGVQEFSKRNPYLVAGGMFAFGMAFSRFMKAGQK